jgi:hypothetical protein
MNSTSLQSARISAASPAPVAANPGIPIHLLRVVQPPRAAASTRGSTAGAESITLKTGQVMHDAGVFDQGIWRVAHGALRFDLVGAGVERFIQLVLAGDHLGVESLCGLPTLYRATAVTRCVLLRQAVVHETEQQALISTALTRQWCRAADTVALRSGSAGERVRQLLLLLSAGGSEADEGYTPMDLPRLTDLAAIVDVAPETVSRVISTWRQQAVLLGTGAGSTRVDCHRLARIHIPPGITRSSRRDEAAS